MEDNYNHFRPHSALGEKSPEGFINQITPSAEFSTIDIS
jgi:transposase InsO family protein